LLRNSPYQDLRNKAMIAYPAPGKLDPKKLPALSVLALKKGDIARGKALMASSGTSQLQCLKCHAVQGSGGAIGPDLSMIGKKGTKENLYESLINPNKAIADQYLTWIIETKKGQVITGLIVEESPELIVLRDGNGKDYKIDRKDVESKAKGPNSLMPSDLINSMSEQDLIDLVDYLATLQTAAFSPEWFHIIGPFENGVSDENFEKTGEPEAKVELEKKLKGKSGPVAWSKVRASSNGYLNLALHFSPENNGIISYLYQVIDSPIDQESTILVGADDCVKLWVNNAEVFKDKNHFAAQPARNSVAVKLKKGANPILIKINNGEGEHGLYFSILSKEPLKIGAKQ
jgi:putative heme-binding domain-containing protein